MIQEKKIMQNLGPTITWCKERNTLITMNYPGKLVLRPLPDAGRLVNAEKVHHLFFKMCHCAGGKTFFEL